MHSVREDSEGEHELTGFIKSLVSHSEGKMKVSCSLTSLFSRSVWHKCITDSAVEKRRIVILKVFVA